MTETIKEIDKKDNKLYFEKGFWIEIMCCMCWDEMIYVGENEEHIINKLNEAGWREIMSERYQVEGWYCGCSYLDEVKK